MYHSKHVALTLLAVLFSVGVCRGQFCESCDGVVSYDTLGDGCSSYPSCGCESGMSCGNDKSCDQSLLGTLLENLSLFGGLEGSKQPQDFGVNANFGGRFHANMGIPLMKECGLGLQIGTAINYTDNAVQVFERVEGNRDRFQSYSTLGLFQRLDCGFSWAVGYDFLYQESFDNFNLGQWRSDLGYRFNQCHEVGTWFTISDKSDGGNFGGSIPLTFDPITQGSVYYRRNWENDAQTTVWLGVAEGHSEVNVALGDLDPVGERVVFGADIFVPLSTHLAIFGQANFLTPADSGTVDSFLGIAYYPGGSHGARERKFAPRLPVGNNTTFATDLSR